MKKKLLLYVIGLGAGAACTDLDIPPKNIIGDEALLTSNAGVEIYMARMYSLMPFEDFKWSPKFAFFKDWIVSPGTEGTGEAVGRDVGEAFVREGYDSNDKDPGPYWSAAFRLLRDANYLMENLPAYKDNFSEADYNGHLGQAYFVRAYLFYTLARRYGGAPLVLKVIDYPAEASALEVPRSSEEDTWNQTLADFDQAAALLPATSPKRGYANKWAALAFKSEAALYAGSVAKYNTPEITGAGIGKKTNVRVMGFEDGNAAAKRYFKEAYTAANTIIKDGPYSLYKKKWSADPEAQYQNMVDMFSDLSSPENILVKEYIYPTAAHGHDIYNGPRSCRNDLSSGCCPTLDFLELFDGFPRNADGTVKVTEDDGTYKMYDKPMDFFANAEPRLRAYVIFPYDQYKGKEIEIRAGVYQGTLPLPKFDVANTYGEATIRYNESAKYPVADLIVSKSREGEQTMVDTAEGKQMTASADPNGPFWDQAESAITGLYLRKYLNPNLENIDQGRSDQPWVIMRYGEVLLNAAEAGVELLRLSESSPDGSDMATVATQAVKDIRERAGANALAGNLSGDIASRDTIRKERRKELAFEYKTLWDLRRWRVQHEGARLWNAGNSSGEEYRFRGLYPFFATENGKWFFDARFQSVALKTFRYKAMDYYFEIPSGEVAKSPVIDQQPNR